jgi:hypothetical protein
MDGVTSRVLIRTPMHIEQNWQAFCQQLHIQTGHVGITKSLKVLAPYIVTIKEPYVHLSAISDHIPNGLLMTWFGRYDRLFRYHQ